MDKKWGVDKGDQALAHLSVPPHSRQSEQSLLGALMRDVSALDKIISIIEADDFYCPANRKIYRAITDLVDRDKPFDVTTVSDQLALTKQLDGCGGLPYLLELVKNTPGSANVTAYADVISKKSMLRQLTAAASETTESVFCETDKEATELIAEAEERFFRIGERGVACSAPRPIQKGLAVAVQRIDDRYRGITASTGLLTGFNEFDHITGGLNNGELTIIAARPSMGKTTFLMSILNYVAIKTMRPILFFSLEMPESAIIDRAICSLAPLTMEKMRTGKLKGDDWNRFSSALEILQQTKLFIDDAGGLSVNELRSRARRVKREQGDLALIAVDYLQLMNIGGKSENRTIEITKISQGLKQLSKELNCPVIALSQLNRQLESRADKRPMMSDLRDSGAIEQDADLITFIYRDEVYNKNTEDRGMAEILISKNRNGATGTVNLHFIGENFKFTDPSTAYAKW